VSQAVAFDSGQAVLSAAPIGWRAGDTLLLVNEQGQNTLANLISVQGQSIVYSQRKASPSDADFVAHALYAGSQPEMTVYPKIANLSRRLQIVSADVVEGDTHHRAHTLIMEDGVATIRNVELRDLGPREKLGRYPVHFHHGGRTNDVLEGSSIWQDVTEPGNRFVAIHDVQGVRVANNVAFRARGHGFFMESGPEFDNQVIGNLSVEVTMKSWPAWKASWDRPAITSGSAAVIRSKTTWQRAAPRWDWSCLAARRPERSTSRACSPWARSSTGCGRGRRA
jgi:hypothetical protein